VPAAERRPAASPIDIPAPAGEMELSMSKLWRKTKTWASMAVAVCLLAGSACLPGMTARGEEAPPADKVPAADAQSYAVYREQYRKKDTLSKTIALTGGQAHTLSDGVRRETVYEGRRCAPLGGGGRLGGMDG